MAVNGGSQTAEQALEAICDQYPKLFGFHPPTIGLEVGLTQVAHCKKEPFFDIVRELQERPSILGTWYQDIVAGYLPPEVSRLIADAIEVTLRLPDASKFELASMVSADPLPLPSYLMPDGNEAPRCYLDIPDLLQQSFNGLRFHGLNSICAVGSSWPFFLGIPTGEFSSVRGIVNQAFLGTHDLYTGNKGEVFNFDGGSNRTSLDTLKHDYDHIGLMSGYLNRRVNAILNLLEVSVPVRHRNFLVPLAVVDIYFKSLVLNSFDRYDDGLTPIQKKIAEAFLFSFHEPGVSILPPALQPDPNVTQNPTKLDIYNFMQRWRWSNDIRPHFDGLGEDVVSITKADTLAAIVCIANCIARALRRFGEDPMPPGPVNKLMALVRPAYIEAIIKPNSNQSTQWAKNMQDIIERMGPEEMKKPDILMQI